MALNPCRLLAFVVLSTCLNSPVLANDNVLVVQQQGDISYVSGGIGTDERDELEAVKHNYNLRVMNADKTGHFSGDTHITISDSKHNVLLDAPGGPLFYANLPKGHYIVEGFSQDLNKKQAIAITGKSPVAVRFVWPQDTTE